MGLGTAVLLLRRWQVASHPRRRALTPVLVAAAVYAVLPIVYLGAMGLGDSEARSFAEGVVALAIVAPLAILAGLSRERFFVAQAVADYVGQLARDPDADPQTLMAAALGDPTLQIDYWRPQRRTYVNRLGRPAAGPPATGERAVTWIERERRPVAAISYNADLGDQGGFVQAAGYAALMHLESAQLEADLRASTADLEASRIRLVEAAHEERKRIERDLHDSVQQELVALRIKLEMAADALGTEPARGERMVRAVGRQIDDVLETLRNIARGIYPPLLQQRGIGPALSAAAQRLPLPVTVQAAKLARYHEDIEVAIYFCCLEALQNVVKHAGVGAHATVSLWSDGHQLRFEVSDTGRGFDAGRTGAGSGAAPAGAGNGLTNMRDRIEAVGGTLTVDSSPELGTRVWGRTPVAPSHAQWPLHAAAQDPR
jgi:signal transduction histidine kinase